MNEQNRIPAVDQIYSATLCLDREKVLQFAGLSGDKNPLHISARAARQYGFARAVCHGALLLSEISRIIGMELPGNGALWSDMTVDFLSPVYWGDQVAITARVVQASTSINMIKLQIQAHTDQRQVLKAKCTVICLLPLGRRLPVPAVDQRIALVTGGSRGLGLAIVREFLKAGYQTISLSRTESAELNQLREQSKNLFVIFQDLQDPAAVKDKLAQLQLPGINVIVHTASPRAVKSKINSDLYADLLNYMDIYNKSLIALLDLSLPVMKKQKFGRIITIGTSFMLGTPPPAMYAYVAAKEALWGLTKCLAADYGRYGITANMVSPTMMITDMTSEISNIQKIREVKSNPMQRMVEPDEVAKVVGFLCGENAAFINGTNMPVTGGKQ